jgi:lauroyl/myristoyl acyltransferase
MRLLTVQDLYWLCVILIIRVAGWLPSLGARKAVTRGAAWLGYHSARNRRRAIEEHVTRAFGGELSDAGRQRVVRTYFREYWREALSLLPTAPDRALLGQAHIQGWQHLQEALEAGRGVILWEASVFGSRNVAKRILQSKGIHVHQVHAPSHIGWEGLDDQSPTSWLREHVIIPVFRTWMGQSVAEIIWLPQTESLAFTRVLLDRLKQNAVLCSTADGRLGERPLQLEFLGHHASYATGLVSLARMSGAPLLPMFCMQDESGRPTLSIERPIRPDAHASRMTASARCVAEWLRLFDSYVRSYPEKYRGWHLFAWDEQERSPQ